MDKKGLMNQAPTSGQTQGMPLRITVVVIPAKAGIQALRRVLSHDILHSI